MSADIFKRNFNLLILLSWLVPPVFGLSFLVFIRIFSPEQMGAILTSPIGPVLAVGALLAAFWFLNRCVVPIHRYLESGDKSLGDAVLVSMRRFPLFYWGLFIGTLLLAPASIIIAAETATDFVARPVDWFRIHLVALIVSIIVGLPIYFKILDLFGRVVGDIPLVKAHVTLKTKVFLIGALVPLLIDTMLVQYYWTRTGYFGVDIFAVWLILELLAIAGSLIFARSIGQSIQPLSGFIESQARLGAIDATQLRAQSTDELGVITSDIRVLAEQLELQSEILQMRNQVLASSSSEMMEEAIISILDICDGVLGVERSFILMHDASANELVNVAITGNEYKSDGYYKLPLTTSASVAVLSFKSGQTISITDATHDKRVNRDVVNQQGILSCIATPLRYGDNSIGVLVATTTTYHREFGSRDVQLVEALAQETALVIHTLMLHQQQRKAERRYRELNELAPDAVLLLDETARIAEANRAAEILLGAKDSDLVGKRFSTFVKNCEYVSEIIEDCGSEDLDDVLAKAAAGKTLLFHAELAANHEGPTCFIDIHAARLELGGKLMTQAFVRDVTDSKFAEDSIRRSERELNSILDSLQDTFYRTDVEGRLVRVSPSVESLLGYKPEELIGTKMADLYVDDTGREKFLEEMEARKGIVKGYQAALWCKNKTAIWASTNAQYFRDEQGNIAGIEGTTRDITKYKRTQEELFKEKERAQVTLESIGDGVVTTDVSGGIEYINPVAEQICGWSIESAEGRSFEEVFRFLEEVTRQPVESPILQCLEKRHPISSDVNIILIGKHGREFAVEYSASPIRDRFGGLVGVVVGLHDVTEMRELAQQLTHQATHDALTGLINRREFELRLKEALESAHSKGTDHALCYLDLDQFKVVNDTCGHIAGDELLKQVTARLREKVRKADTLARLGGDEFGVLLHNCGLSTAEKVTDDLRKTVKEFRFSWEDRTFEIGVSIGLVPIDANSGTLTDILSAADSACYAAKEQGRNRVHLYQPDDKVLAQRHGEMQWVSRISQALEEDRLIIFAQRIKSLQNSAIDHWEILVRMQADDGGIVPPMAFIPAAERYHVMPEIDRWVLGRSFELIAENTKTLGDDAPIFNFNLSGQSLSDDTLWKFVTDQIDRRTIDPEKICFEITETAAIANLTHATRFIAVLTGMGCRFALDDFGSGLSSFAYLKNLNVSYLKIDGAFVRDMVDDPINYAMVESINHVGHTLGIKTIAEFVESKKILQAVENLGIDYAQGYQIAKPVPVDESFFANYLQVCGNKKAHKP